MPKLFIRLRAPAVATDEGYEVTSDWMIQEDDGRTRARGETDFRGLSELIDPGTDWVKVPGNIVVTVPSENVLSLACEVPGRSAGQVRRALPFVVEEFVATDIESMHLATGEVRRGAPTRVQLIERTLLDDWIACLNALDIQPGYVFSDAELLPVADREASLLLEEDRVLIRTADQAVALDRDNLALAVGGLGVERLRIVYGELTNLEYGQLAPELTVEPSEHPAASVLEFIAAHWRTADAINLLQGAYRPNQPANPMWQRWRGVAALAAAWIGVMLLTMTAEGFYAGYQADTLEAESERLYRDIFPNERRVTNVRRQLLAKLGDRAEGGGGGFVDYLGPLAGAMTPATRVQSVSYTEDRGELAVDLITGGFDALDRLKQLLAEQGVAIEITSAEQVEQGVRARIRLRDAGAAP